MKSTTLIFVASVFLVLWALYCWLSYSKKSADNALAAENFDAVTRAGVPRKGYDVADTYNIPEKYRPYV